VFQSLLKQGKQYRKCDVKNNGTFFLSAGMSRHGSRPLAAPKPGGVSPAANEFQNACKFSGLQDEELISEWTTLLTQYEGEMRLMNKTVSSQVSKAILRFLLRYPKFSRVSFFSCYFQDQAFYSKFAADFPKFGISQLSLDFAPVARDSISPLLLMPNLDLLSVRGNICITGCNYWTGAAGYFSDSLNTFYKNLASSNLKALDLTGCRIGNEGAISIAHTLFFTANLRCINLSSNRIGDSGASCLAAALSSYTLTVQEMEVQEILVNEESKQKLSDEGGGLVKRKKGGKPIIRKGNPKSKKGLPQKTTSVRTLSFDPYALISPAVLAKWNYCVAQEDGTMILPGNMTLTTLILDDNLITERGLSMLSDMLKTNTRLVNFSISANPDIPSEMIQRVTRKCVSPPLPSV
jgi:hypothetical protein